MICHRSQLLNTAAVPSPPPQVSDCINGGISASTVFQALDYAHRMGAHVVSMAIGSTYQYGFSPTTPAPSYHAQWTASYQQALQPLADKGVLVVVAAGASSRCSQNPRLAQQGR